jgi:tRNA-specific 2-thiouridylase
VPRARIGEMLLPIGGMHKPRVRELAKEWGLPVFDKPDSQEICFVPDNDYAGLVERMRPELAAPGVVVDAAGGRLGEHGGHHRFTVGQRRGVQIAGGTRLYVIQKDAATNTVRLGPPEMLESSGCVAGEANWLADGPAPGEWGPCLAVCRYNGAQVEARVRVITEAGEGSYSGRRGRFEVRFESAQRAIAPGQAVVLYETANPDVVLGGGWIESVNRGAGADGSRGTTLESTGPGARSDG